MADPTTLEPPAAPATTADPFVFGGRPFRSRLIVGTGKYATFPLMKAALEESQAEIVTVAVRRVNLTDRSKESLLDYVPRGMTLLPNTAGCYNADDAVRAARLGREVGLSNWVKLEVLGDEQTLWPDNEALLAATKTLVGEGFVVFPYTSDDPIVCRKLEDAGAAAVMPLGAPIGSGLGIQNPNSICDHPRARQGPGHRGRGRGHGVGCVRRHGTRRRRRADEHGHRRRRRSGPDGPRHAGRRSRRAGRLPGRTHPEEALRDGVLAGPGRDRVVTACRKRHLLASGPQGRDSSKPAGARKGRPAALVGAGS